MSCSTRVSCGGCQGRQGEPSQKHSKNIATLLGSLWSWVFCCSHDNRSAELGRYRAQQDPLLGMTPPEDHSGIGGDDICQSQGSFCGRLYDFHDHTMDRQDNQYGQGNSRFR